MLWSSMRLWLHHRVIPVEGHRDDEVVHHPATGRRPIVSLPAGRSARRAHRRIDLDAAVAHASALRRAPGALPHSGPAPRWSEWSGLVLREPRALSERGGRPLRGSQKPVVSGKKMA